MFVVSNIAFHLFWFAILNFFNKDRLMFSLHFKLWQSDFAIRCVFKFNFWQKKCKTRSDINVVIKPEFSKFPKKIKVWSLSSSRCKFSVSVDFVSQKKSRQKVFMSFIEDFNGEVNRSWSSLTRCDESSKCREGPEFLSV